MVGEGPWYRADRQTMLFARREDLASGPLALIDPDAAEDRAQFWSGTRAGGIGGGATCDDWTEHLGPDGTVSRVDRVGAGWSTGGKLYCGTYLALLRIEQ